MSNLTTSLLAFGALSHIEPHRPNLLSGAMHRLATEFRARRAARAVASLSDASLHDIGLARGEIESAVRFGRHHGA